ncbi:putative late blight resistance protein homolog R1B-16 [Henckelia pumila]|uniref:putative late blight resistance protein homolog R1B-16 n=1 Tax=Henckelia pumila TaxID=405737 RepID=UPI003C6E7291
MAYAALVSVSQTLEQILDSDPYFFPCAKEKVVSFQETIASLIAFLDNCPPIGTQTVNDSIRRIRDSAYEAEDVFESLLATHFLQKYGSDGYEKLQPGRSVEKVMEDMESIEKQVLKIHDDHKAGEWRNISTLAGSSRPASAGGHNPKMVALDNDLEIKLTEQLVGGGSKKLDVVPIVGMGGIGKTTLARILYGSKLIVDTFDVCGWATISQTYGVTKIASDILKDISVGLDGGGKYKGGGPQDVYQTLYGRKYLIVLDDVWDTQAWHDIKRSFPENKNGSRVLMTTRHSKVAAYVNSSGSYHEMQLLNEDSSWRLLRQEVFPQQNIHPSEVLVEIGKEIARQCQGLPLAISAIGGHLKKEKQTQEYWKYVSENVSSVADDPSLEILTLSYNYLPHHLKACFLYFGSFQDVHSIDVFQLLRLWVAEGFIQPSPSLRETSMEEVAEEYLRDFIDRNLVFVYKHDALGKPKRCGIHDLFRDICIKEAKKEKFLFILNKDHVLFDHDTQIDSQRRLILSPDIIDDYDESLISALVSRNGTARSFICHDDNTSTPTITLTSARLLKVLRIRMSDSSSTPPEILQLAANLTYLELGYNPKIPSTISRLRNLQTIVADIISMPPEIWEMTQLRHVKSNFGTHLPDIPPAEGSTNNIILENMQTLWKINNFRCVQEVVKRIPNLKTLSLVYYDDVGLSSQYVNNLVCLAKLESLHCHFDFGPNDHNLRNLAFPPSLKQLVLMGCHIPWEKITNIIGILPELEVLKLKYGATKGKFWKTNDGAFEQLKFLLIQDSDIAKWKTEAGHFPSLQHLILEECHALKGIPSEIGEIPTLEKVQLLLCSDAAQSSAMEMFGEDSDVKLIISSYDSILKIYKSADQVKVGGS